MADFREGFKACARVMLEVGNEFLVEKAAICGLQVIGKVPMEKRDHGGDASFEEVVDKFHIVIDSGLTDWIITTTFWNDSGPGYRKAVGFCSTLLKESDVLCCPGVGVASSYARLVTSNFAPINTSGTECIPY